MRVGLVSPYSWAVPGGVNEHIADLAVHLGRMGHEAWVLAPTSGGRAAASSADETRPHRSDVDLVPMGSTMRVSSNGSTAYVTPYPFMLQRVARTLARYRFDVLHVHEPCIPGLPWAAVMRAISPTVGTFHAALQSSALYSLLAPLARLAMDNLEVKIAVSAAALDYLAGRFPGDYRIIPNGVDVQEYGRARSGSRVPGRILYVGRADPRKGLTVLLRAFALVRREMPWASLVLAGPSR